MLIEKYKEYQEKGLVITENIMKFTKKTKEENDIFKLYLDERTRESKTHILIRELYDDFKYWYQTNNPNKKIPNSREFAKEIKKYHTVNDRVRVNNSVSTGILNLSIVNNE